VATTAVVRQLSGVIAVVTGSSGFIGSHLVERLTAEGRTVRRLLRAGASPSSARTVGIPLATRLDDVDAILRSGALAGADVVFHLAGVTKARSASGFRDGNVAPTTAIVEALRRLGQGTRLVLVSSQAAAGPAASSDRPVREDDAASPVEGYGRSKLEAERVALDAGARVPAVVVRPTAVYGPRDLDFFRAFRSASLGVALLPGSRARWFDVAHVADVVEALTLAAIHPDALGRTFFVGAAPTTWDALYDELARTVGRTLRQVRVPDWAMRVAGVAGSAAALATGRATLLNAHKTTLGRQDYWLCSDDSARSTLGYSPRRTLPEGIRETYLWYVDNGWLRPARGDARDRRS
jgi:nucleoside-diphosphate-sugar epimerase